MRADGTVEAFGEPGTLLGVVPEPDLTSSETELYPGDTVIFYTDGITEARTPNGMIGFHGLLSAVRGCAGCAAAEVAERIEQSLLDIQTTELRDDVALVVAQIAGGGDDRRGATVFSARTSAAAQGRSRPSGAPVGVRAAPLARQRAALGERLVTVLDAARHLVEHRRSAPRRRVRREELGAPAARPPSGAHDHHVRDRRVAEGREGLVSPEIMPQRRREPLRIARQLGRRCVGDVLAVAADRDLDQDAAIGARISAASTITRTMMLAAPPPRSRRRRRTTARAVKIRASIAIDPASTAA